jgi:Haem-NO-binding
MMGLVQKVLLDVVEERCGRAAVSEVRDRAGVAPGQVFRLGESYPDDEWRRLFSAACDLLGLTEEELLELYADAFCRDALTRFSKWFEMSRSSREFLERQVTIHNVFAAGVRDPEARKRIADKFWIEEREEGIVTHYRSANRLCAMYRALARWIIRHYGEEATIEETRCMRRGDEECEIHVAWQTKGRRSDVDRGHEQGE